MYDSNTTGGFLEISSSATSTFELKPTNTKTALVVLTETVSTSTTTTTITSTTFPSSAATSRSQPFVSSPFKVGSLPALVSSSGSTSNTGGTIRSTSTESHGVSTSSFQPDQPSSAAAERESSDGGSPPNAAMIILIVIGIIAACALALLFIWWCKGRRYGTRGNVIYPFFGNSDNIAYEQRFRQALGKRPYFELESNPQGAINPFTASRSSFGDNGRGGNTSTSLGEQTSSDIIVIGRSGLSSPHVRFDEKPLRDSENDSDGGTGPGHPAGIRKGATQGDRPPTYCTNSTGLATITTLLPQYSVVDPSPSPISERSDTSPTPSSLTTSPFSQRRGFGRHSHHPSPLTPIGEKF